MSNLIPKTNRYLDLLTTVEDVINVFPTEQSRQVWNFVDIPDGDWTVTLEWLTVIADQVKFSNPDDKPNFANSLVTGYFEGGSLNFGSTQSIRFPAGMYTGPILPASETNIPITVANLQWTKNTGETFNKQFLLIQNWTPGVEIGDPTDDEDYIPIDIPGIGLFTATVILEQFGPTIYTETFNLKATVVDVPTEISNGAKARFYAILTGTTYSIIGTSTFTNNVAEITIPTYRADGDPLNFPVGNYTVRAEWPGRRIYPKKNSNTVTQAVIEGTPLNVNLSLQPSVFTNTNTTIAITAVATTQSGFPTIGQNIANTVTFTLVGSPTFTQLSTTTLGKTQFAGSSNIATATGIFTTTELYFDQTLNPNSTYTVNTATIINDTGYQVNATVSRNYTVRANWDYYRPGLYAKGNTSTTLVSTTTRNFLFTIPQLQVYTSYAGTLGDITSSTVYNTGSTKITAIANIDSYYVNTASNVVLKAYYTSTIWTYPVTLGTGTITTIPAPISQVVRVVDAKNFSPGTFNYTPQWNSYSLTTWIVPWKWFSVQRLNAGTTQTQIVSYLGSQSTLSDDAVKNLNYWTGAFSPPLDYTIFRGQKIWPSGYFQTNEMAPLLPNGSFGNHTSISISPPPPAFVDYPGITDYYGYSLLYTSPESTVPTDISGTVTGPRFGQPVYQGDLIFYGQQFFTGEFIPEKATKLGTISVTNITYNPGQYNGTNPVVYSVFFTYTSSSVNFRIGDYIVTSYNYLITNISGNQVTAVVNIPYSAAVDYNLNVELQQIRNSTLDLYRNTPDNLRIRTTATNVTNNVITIQSPTTNIQIGDYFVYDSVQYTIISKTINSINISPVPAAGLQNQIIDILQNDYNPPSSDIITATITNLFTNEIQLNRLYENLNEYSYFIVNNILFNITSLDYSRRIITTSPNWQDVISSSGLLNRTITILNSISSQDPVVVNTNTLQLLNLGNGVFNNNIIGSGISSWTTSTVLNSGTYFIFAEYVAAANTNTNRVFVPIKNSDAIKVLSEDGFTANLSLEITAVNSNYKLTLRHLNDPNVSQAYLFTNPVTFRYNNTAIGTGTWTVVSSNTQISEITVSTATIVNPSLTTAQWPGSMNQLTANAAQKKYLPQTVNWGGNYNTLVTYSVGQTPTAVKLNDSVVAANYATALNYGFQATTTNFVSPYPFTGVMRLLNAQNDAVIASTTFNANRQAAIAWNSNYFTPINATYDLRPIKIQYQGDIYNSAYENTHTLLIVNAANSTIERWGTIIEKAEVVAICWDGITANAFDAVTFGDIECTGSYKLVLPSEYYTVPANSTNDFTVNTVIYSSSDLETWNPAIDINNAANPYWRTFRDNSVFGAPPAVEITSVVQNGNEFTFNWKFRKLHSNTYTRDGIEINGLRFVYNLRFFISFNKFKGYNGWNWQIDNGGAALAPIYCEKTNWQFRYRTVVSNSAFNFLPQYGTFTAQQNQQPVPSRGETFPPPNVWVVGYPL